MFRLMISWLSEWLAGTQLYNHIRRPWFAESVIYPAAILSSTVSPSEGANTSGVGVVAMILRGPPVSHRRK
ncbi:hypothetical protein BJ138DRAFT_545584 [Hygrophoropsis aurantiaca]|uniref:Uncharacterized protein n=1 Tax=Hygrophoropsis aurantiaca TaxID=72124 RepID=A0ACB8A323_9AGAM|nr:hypothetical protein BJ138DRAFT_545584 [Hygrophoropsis aurantiaca]